MECAICRERSSSRMLRAELRQSSDSRPRRHRSLALAGTPRCAAVYRCRWPALTRRERYSGCRLTALPKVDVRIANSTPSAMRRGRSPIPRTSASPLRGSTSITFVCTLTDQHRGPKVSEEWDDVPNVHGDCVVRIERLPHASEVVCTDGVDGLKSGMSFEYCVGERHPAPRRRWDRHVMKHDSVAFSEQAMRYGRPNVPDATDEHPHSLRLHPAHRTATEPQTACVRRQITLSSRPHVPSFNVSEVLSAARWVWPKGSTSRGHGSLACAMYELRIVNRATSERPTL